ncbi:peptidoglycan-binding protein LysM [Amaricoccus solimangrovi]|uniref:Peptidoglycan-binding protein LysM n=1 Tax=Amaricoccus solimangrovi TaxID=2589815 RepID=A0A501WXZ5_9RHOB|nr:peptidoglycan-binding protein LysM [Amaricoccus solimangrovi]TPE53125.1 peptidoglycan-binding protein LysM [Amaricoccus solimangrovi]
MGLWDFVKGAGKAIGIGPAEAKEPEEAPTPDALRKEIEDLGLKADDLKVEVEGDKVKVSGKALSQEEKEKIILATGNVKGVAKVEDDISAPDPGEPVFHTVVKGDTLWAISEKTLGEGARYKEIFEANRPMLSDPDKIYPGQVLRIPAK